MQVIFLLQRWMLFNLLGNSHACYGAGVQLGKKCIYVRWLSGNWKLEVKSEETLQSFHSSYQKAEDVNFFKVFLKISSKRGIRFKLQRCSTNMNIKGRSRIRISRIYSDRGQTVWSCHPQFREDFKKYNLQKRTISPEKYFNALQVGNNALNLKHVWSFTNWIPILNFESKWAPTTLPAFDRHFGLGLHS